MGQIIGSAAKPKRCNLNKLSQLETPAAGEYILVSSDNSMNAAGQGNFDSYIVGNGRDAATGLTIQWVCQENSYNLAVFGTTYSDMLTAVAAVPSKYRKLGMHVIYLDSDGNVQEVQFIGSAISLWSSSSSYWRNIEIEKDYFDISSNITSGKYINESGVAYSNPSYNSTGYIDIYNGNVASNLKYGLWLFSSTSISLYDEDYTFLAAFTGATSSNVFTEGEIDISQYPTARYFRATLYGEGNYVIRYLPSLVQVADSSITTNKVASLAITTDKIAKNAVTMDKVSFYSHNSETNYIDRTALTAGYYINASGVPTTTPSSSYYITDKVYLEEGVSYYRSGLYTGYFAFYKEDGTLIQGYGAGNYLTNPFTVPTGTSYGRFTINTAGANETCWIYTSNGRPSDYARILDESLIPTLADHENRILSLEGTGGVPTDYKGRDICVFNKIVCIGDSLTAGTFNYYANSSFANYVEYAKYSYPTMLAKLTGCSVSNLGIGGASSSVWYSTYASSSELTGCDCAIIQLGVNDASATLETTSKEAFQNIITLLKSNNNGIKIFLSGIINAQSYQCAASGESYYTKDQFIRSLYEELYADDDQVFFIDHVAYGHLRDLGTAAYDNYNEGHLSAYGYWMLAQDYVSYISYIMHTDTENRFKTIQFIGTEYEGQ